MQRTSNIGYWESFNGSEIGYYNDNTDEYITENEYWELDQNERENYTESISEVYQTYIISERGANILKECTDEIVWYNDELNMYGVYVIGVQVGIMY